MMILVFYKVTFSNYGQPEHEKQHKLLQDQPLSKVQHRNASISFDKTQNSKDYQPSQR